MPIRWRSIGAGGVLTFQGNPDLKSEKGDTWTAGMVFQSPFQNVLASRITATVDWYRVKITDPIDVVSGQLIVDACFNVNGTNPNYQLNDPTGYCRLIERDPSSGGIRTINAIYDNIGRLGVEGIDTTVRWNARAVRHGHADPARHAVGRLRRQHPDQAGAAGVGGRRCAELRGLPRWRQAAHQHDLRLQLGPQPRRR